MILCIVRDDKNFMIGKCAGLKLVFWILEKGFGETARKISRLLLFVR